MSSPRFVAVMIFVFLLVLGLAVTLRARRQIKKRWDFAVEYRENFVKFTHKPDDQQLFQWLQLNSVRIQKESGAYGVADRFQPAYEGYAIRNYQVFINLLSEIVHWYQESGMFRFTGPGILNQYIQMFDNCLLNYLGHLKDRMETLGKEYANPFVWLREGVRAVVKFPISFLYWTGILNYSRYVSVTGNMFSKLVGMVVGTIGFVSGVITIVTGYCPFIDVIRNYM